MKQSATRLAILGLAAAIQLLDVPAQAGEPRMAVIIHAGKSAASIHASRTRTSAKRYSLKSGEKLALMTDCRNAKGTVVVSRWDKAFGKAGGNPQSIHGLWCDVGYRVPSSQVYVRGWLQGKYLQVLPAE